MPSPDREHEDIDSSTRRLHAGDVGDATRPHASSPASSELHWSVDDDDARGSIGRYSLLERLGRGGFGVVYRAEDQVLKRHVALKLLTRFQTTGEVDAWMQEAVMLAGLDHPSIVPVFDVGKTEHGQPYIVSKIIEGGTLHKRVAQGPWSIADSVRVVAQLARALEYLHRRGVIHRDIKPSNILTTHDGNAVLADFGLAMPESDFGRGSRFVGTPAYMSPEQARHEGHRVDGRSDIYSLGVVFYELLTNKRPFQVADREQLLECIRTVEVRPPRQIEPEIPRELERICLKALSKKISDRYSTAGDLAQDLDDWREEFRDRRTPASAEQIQRGPLAAPMTESTKSLDLDTIAVIPRGLRPFDESDADFFRFLLPGARDRLGIPESIRFWTRSILSNNPDLSFRVGVLLGPSGSGKSSLMRAGVIPLIEKEVATVYVEAKPEQLEANLYRQLQRIAPSSPSNLTLPDLIATIRQNRGTRDAKKLLIVIDQFEQWLNRHQAGDSPLLREALRQCDGISVQVILIVRDDFVLGISAFMDELDESLRQNGNFATIEPFGAVHAKHVLSAFGRAYGTIQDPPTPAQKAFIEEAIQGFEAIGRIDPLQIALLSEMTKGKPWTPHTLRELGGITGLGVAFLDEKLSGLSAHPILRTHPQVVRRLLSELLPQDNTVIKAPAMRESELLQRMDGTANEEMLRKILQLLDTEVRLITPTSSARSSEGSHSGSSTSDPAYQLTHDYLVPTTRSWLSMRQSESRAGRVREQLRELAATWSAKPSVKRLPSLLEWLSIRWFTRSAQWSQSERRMMAACDRRLASRATGIAVTGILALLTSTWLYYRSYAEGLGKRIQEVDPTELRGLLAEADRYRKTVVSRWVGMPKPSENTNNNEITEHNAPAAKQRQLLQWELANAISSSESTAFVLEHLGDVPDRDLQSFVDYLARSPHLENAAIERALTESLAANAQVSLSYAALLAARDDKRPEWEEWAPKLVELLLDKSATQVAFWTDLLKPVRHTLVEPLLRTGEQLRRERSKLVDVARALVANFAQRDAKSLAQAAAWTGPESIPRLLVDSSMQDSVVQEARQLASELLRPPFAVSEQRIAPDLAAITLQYEGYINEQGGWMERIPLEKLNDTVGIMKGHGYVLASLRPYLAGAARDNEPASLLAATAWQRLPRESEVALAVSKAEFESLFEAKKQSGWMLVDFATLNTSPGEPPDQWWAVWHREGGKPAIDQQLHLDVPEETAQSPTWERNGEEYVIVRTATRLTKTGDFRHDYLLAEVTAEMFDTYEERAKEVITWSRIAFAAGDLYPGLRYSDLRSESTYSTQERGKYWDEYYSLVSTLPIQPKIADFLQCARTAQRLVDLGEFARALEWLDRIDDAKVQEATNADADLLRDLQFKSRGAALAHLGRVEELKEWMETRIDAVKTHEGEKQLLRLRLAAASDNREEALRLLTDLESKRDTSENARGRCTRALAIVASKSWGEDSENAYTRLKGYVAAWLPALPELFGMLFSSDMDSFRNKADWIAWLEDLRLGSRVSAASYMKLRTQTEFAIDLAPEQARKESISRMEQGFVPSTVHVRVDARGVRRISMIWERTEPSAADLADHDRRVAELAIALAYWGQPYLLRDGLLERQGRGVRSVLIDRSLRLIPANTFLQWLQAEANPSMQSACLEILGAVEWNQLDPASQEWLRPRVLELASNSDDARLQSVAQWCCGRWSLTFAAPKPSQGEASDRNWLTNSLGQRLIVVPARNKQVPLGKEDRRRTWIQMEHDVAIAATETTGDEFRLFLEDPKVRKWMAEQPVNRGISRVVENLPQRSMSWEIAVHFCQWLNERENIPESEWCYENCWATKSSNTKDTSWIAYPKKDALKKKGYRLPTQAEWMYACSAGSDGPWHFGNDSYLTPLYEWTMPHSKDRTHRVATLRPNAWGFFDMGGNLAEWTHHRTRSNARDTSRYFVFDDPDTAAAEVENRVQVGGRFRYSEMSAMSDVYAVNTFQYLSITLGFRIARTLR